MAQKLSHKNKRLIDVDVQKVINQNPLTSKILDLRLSVLQHQDIKVDNEYLYQFFFKYGLGTKSLSKILCIGNERTNFKPINGLCIMYSGGSESVYMDHTFNGDLIRGNNFFPHSVNMRREFQCALVGMALSYSTTLIGIEDIETLPRHKIKPELYEWSEDFVSDWNDSFYPFNIQYPTSQFEKIDLYELLIKRGLSFNSCEQSVPCKECWKCCETYWIHKAMNKKPPFEIPHHVLVAKQAENTGLFCAGKIEDNDIFGTVTMMKQVEDKYHYTGWRLCD